MMGDTGTIIWKEWKEILVYTGGRSKLWPLIFLGIFGIFVPLQMGRVWTETPVTLVWWIWIPLILVASVVADCFAGERERHTLETLLASRLSDRAILFGKIMAVASYGWSMTVIALFAGLVTVNLAHGREGLLTYPPFIAFGGIGLSLLMAVLGSTIGTLISLRAATVRQAQQILGLFVMALVWAPIIGLNLLPAAWKAAFVHFLASAGVNQIVLYLGGIVALTDLLLLAACKTCFRRTRLILD